MAQTQNRQAVATYNTDVHSCCRRYNRMLVETMKSQSSGISFAIPFDVTRMRSYIANMEAYLDFVVAQPLLDCPETGPTLLELPENPSIPLIENESGYDVMQLIEIARDELANSQSSRMPTNLMQFDFLRQKSYLSKISKLLDFVAVAEPLDLPESSPMQGVTGAGLLGV